MCSWTSLSDSGAKILEHNLLSCFRPAGSAGWEGGAAALTAPPTGPPAPVSPPQFRNGCASPPGPLTDPCRWRKFETMSQKSPGSGSGSRNLREGLRLLEWLSRCPEGAGVREAAAALGLTHSSAHRFLETMRVAGWVTQSPTTRKYELGPLAVRVGISALARMDLRKVANRALREIAERTGETAYLGVLIGAQVVYVDIVPGARTIGIYRPVGWMYWAFRTAVGKVLLADLPPDRLRELLPEGRLPRTGARGCVSLASLHRELSTVRAAGYAINDEESEPGVYGIAVPIRDGRSQVIAGLGIGGPKDRVRPRRPQLVALLTGFAEAISASLGYPGTAPAWNSLAEQDRKKGG